jgi:hypothetical protein
VGATQSNTKAQRCKIRAIHVFTVTYPAEALAQRRGDPKRSAPAEVDQPFA